MAAFTIQMLPTKVTLCDAKGYCRDLNKTEYRDTSGSGLLNRGAVRYQVLVPSRPERRSPFAGLLTVKALKGRAGDESPGKDAEAPELVVPPGPSEQGET